MIAHDNGDYGDGGGRYDHTVILGSWSPAEAVAGAVVAVVLAFWLVALAVVAVGLLALVRRAGVPRPDARRDYVS